MLEDIWEGFDEEFACLGSFELVEPVFLETVRAVMDPEFLEETLVRGMRRRLLLSSIRGWGESERDEVA